MVLLVLLIITVGTVLTTTASVSVPGQPAPLDALTVKIVVAVGLTIAVVPAIAPGFQVTLGAPNAVKVELPPAQMVAGDAESVKLGNGLTVTATVACAVHPVAANPITVYGVFVNGDTTTDDPVDGPGVHV